MSIICDYHIHTYLCRHACGNPEEYLGEAYRKGLKNIGFSDHSPVPVGFDPDTRMKLDDFKVYREIIERLKDNHYGIDVSFGTEIEWVQARIEEANAFIDQENFDYVIGSVHHVNNLPVDHPDYMELWEMHDSDYVWNKYADALFDMVSSPLKIDMIGHIDLPKKFGFYPENNTYFLQRLSDVFKVASDKNIIIELNTAGLRKPVKEIYPSLEILKLAHDCGGKITFGSDAHAPEEVGAGFTEAALIAMEAGYQEYFVIEKGIKESYPRDV